MAQAIPDPPQAMSAPVKTVFINNFMTRFGNQLVEGRSSLLGMKIKTGSQELPPKKVNLQISGKNGGFLSLLATHRPIEERIALPANQALT